MRRAIYVMIAILMFGGPVAFAASKEELKEMTATIVNLNGHLCASVVDIRPLRVGKNVYEVECIAYRGGDARKKYIMDAAKGTVWIP